jgi:hypothetical protein
VLRASVASEYTATEPMPSRRSVRAMRQAILAAVGDHHLVEQASCAHDFASGNPLGLRFVQEGGQAFLALVRKRAGARSGARCGDPPVPCEALVDAALPLHQLLGLALRGRSALEQPVQHALDAASSSVPGTASCSSPMRLASLGETLPR